MKPEILEELDEQEIDEELTDDEIALLSTFGKSRRQFLGTAGAGIVAAKMLENQVWAGEVENEITQNFVSTTQPAAETINIKLNVNGAEKAVNIETRVTLLDALRENLQLTGSKKGCDHGQCGACTVLIEGRRVLSCLTLTAQVEGKQITTIEGLAKGDNLHPMQESFVKHDGFQCGYCTPGQICSAVALITEAKNGEASYVTTNFQSTARDLKLSDDEIRERMSGNICRCGAYPNIVAAVREIQSGVSEPFPNVFADKA